MPQNPVANRRPQSVELSRRKRSRQLRFISDTREPAAGTRGECVGVTGLIKKGKPLFPGQRGDTFARIGGEGDAFDQNWQFRSRTIDFPKQYQRLPTVTVRLPLLNGANEPPAQNHDQHSADDEPPWGRRPPRHRNRHDQVVKIFQAARIGIHFQVARPSKCRS